MLSLRGKVAIVGVGETEVGNLPHLGTTDLHLKAIKAALKDAGLEKKMVDGMITCNPRAEPYLYHAQTISQYLEISPRYCSTVITGGATPLTVIHHAASAILTGMCSVVVIAMADSMASRLGRDEGVRQMSETAHAEFELPYNPTIPALFALAARAYMHEFGATSEQFARVAVNMRKHAILNPNAQMRTEITVDDVLNSRMIADPLHLLDCCLISDAGGALVITSVEIAKELQKHPIYLLGIAETNGCEHTSMLPSLTETIFTEAGNMAYNMAGLTPDEMDLAMLYDPFTFLVLIQLEDLGFCKRGEGGPFVEDGGIELGGKLPVNTHGGLLSHSHASKPSSLLMVAECVRQLRGECGPRQVKGAKYGLVHCQSAILASSCVVILGKEV